MVSWVFVFAFACDPIDIVLTSRGFSTGDPSATLSVNGKEHALFNDANTGDGLNVWVLSANLTDRFSYFDSIGTHTYDTSQQTAGALFTNLQTFLTSEYVPDYSATSPPPWHVGQPPFLWGTSCGDVIFIAAKREAASGICPLSSTNTIVNHSTTLNTSLAPRNQPCQTLVEFSQAFGLPLMIDLYEYGEIGSSYVAILRKRHANIGGGGVVISEKFNPSGEASVSTLIECQPSFVSCAPSPPSGSAAASPPPPLPPRPPPPPPIAGVQLQPPPSSVAPADFVQTLLSRMTVQQKIAQMLMIEVWLDDPQQRDTFNTAVVSELIQKHGIGGILGGGNSFWPMGERTLRRVANDVQHAAMAHSNQIPIMFGIDAVHGNALIRGSAIFPHNIGLGSIGNDTSLMFRMGRVVAEQLRSTGMHLAFSPCLAVPTDMRWGRAYEGISSDENVVSKLGRAYLEGLQSGPHRVIGCPKHLAGDGGTVYGTGKKNTVLDQGDVRNISWGDLQKHLFPYIDAVEAGAKVIMASYNSINGMPCHANYSLLTEWLKEGLNYSGFILSDWDALDDMCEECWNTKENKNSAGPTYWAGLSDAQVCEYRGCTPRKRYSISVNAGVDMIMMPVEFDEHYWALQEAAAAGADGCDEDELAENGGPGCILPSRIDDAVTRILRVKEEFGLFEDYKFANETLASEIDISSHVALARESAQKSSVLMLNEDDTLPFSSGDDILWACEGSESKSRQLGGWSIVWQGANESAFVQSPVAPFDGSPVLTQSVSEALRKDFWCRGCIFRDVNGSRYPSTSVAVAVISEPPYAEWHGDKAGRSPNEVAMSRNDEKCLKNIYESNPSRPIVILLITGRPIDLRKYYRNESGTIRGQRGVKAILNAWLPGGEGGGVADVLWGRCAVNGSLSVQYGDDFPMKWGYTYTPTWTGCGCRRGPGGILWVLWGVIFSVVLISVLCSFCNCCVRISRCVTVRFEDENSVVESTTATENTPKLLLSTTRLEIVSQTHKG